MIKKSKYCSTMTEKYFNKELVMTNEDKYFKKSTKCWICDNDYDNTHRYCNINVELNHKILIVFPNLKNCDSCLIMQELSKINLQINVTLNGLEKYMSFTVNDKLNFIDSYQFLNSSVYALVKN